MDDSTRDDILMGFNKEVIPRIWITRCVAIMSMIGSFCIIRHSFKKTEGYDMGMYLVVLMSASDVMVSLFCHVIGTTMAPSGLVYGALGNRTTCIVQGYFGFFFGLLGPMINTALALYFLLLVKHGWKRERFESYCNRFWFLLFPTLLSLIIMIIPLIDGGISYNLGTTACGVSPHPPGCNINEEVFGKCESLVVNNIISATFLLALIISGTVIAVSMIKLWIYVRNTEKKSKRHVFQGTENQQGQSTLIGKVGILYSAAFFLTWIFWFINVIIFVIVGKAPLFLKYLTATSIPAQGLMNTFVYFYRVDPHNAPVKKNKSKVTATSTQHIPTTHRKNEIKIEDERIKKEDDCISYQKKKSNDESSGVKLEHSNPNRNHNISSIMGKK